MGDPFHEPKVALETLQREVTAVNSLGAAVVPGALTACEQTVGVLYKAATGQPFPYQSFTRHKPGEWLTSFAVNRFYTVVTERFLAALDGYSLDKVRFPNEAARVGCGDRREPHRSRDRPSEQHASMSKYRRAQVPGATWFFTVNLAERSGTGCWWIAPTPCVPRSMTFGCGIPSEWQRSAFCRITCTASAHWRPVTGRWGLIKGRFSRAIEMGERVSLSRVKRGERGLWQRRFWEHLVRGEDDFIRHVNDIHWDPVTHGCVRGVAVGRNWLTAIKGDY